MHGNAKRIDLDADRTRLQERDDDVAKSRTIGARYQLAQHRFGATNVEPCNNVRDSDHGLSVAQFASWTKRRTARPEAALD
jgi:hypothetical protein